MTSKILVINGPNLNRLGERDVAIYGSATLEDIEALCVHTAENSGFECLFYQSNIEGELIDCLQKQEAVVAGILINPGGYGHTSVALRDALAICGCPVIEVHLSNLAKRESFRQITLTGGVVTGQVSGLGALGYQLGLIGLMNLINGGK